MPAITPYNPNVTRIPVKGPAPFNVLVCVSMTNVEPPSPNEVQVVGDGTILRFGGTIATPFILAGADPRVAPMFQHSTTLSLVLVGPAPANNFVYAVDAVTDAGFDKATNAWYVSWNAAYALTGALPELCVAYQTFVDSHGNSIEECVLYEVPFLLQVTSYVLCYEPPVPPPPPRPPDFAPHPGLQRSVVSRTAGVVRRFNSLPPTRHTRQGSYSKGATPMHLAGMKPPEKR